MGKTELVTLYKAGMPSTMVSSRPAMALKPGEFSDLTNVINRYGVIEVRKSDAALATSGITGTVFYGSWSGTIAGTEYALFAIKNATKVDIYDSTAASAWTKRSATTGPYGDTRLDDTLSAANGVTFQAVNDPVLGEVVVMSDSSTVLVWSPTAVNSERLRKVQSISTMNGWGQSVLQVQGATYSSNIITATGSVTGTKFTSLSGGLITINATGTAGDTLEITLAGSLGVGSTSNQLAIFCTCPSLPYDLFSKCKLELYSSGTYVGHTVYDPSSSTSGAPPSVETYAAGEIEGLSLPAMFVTWSFPNVYTAAVTKMKFTYQGASTELAAGTIQMYALIMNSGSEPPAGYQNYAVAYRNSATGVESPRKVLDSSQQVGDNLWKYTSTLYPASTRLPVSNVFRGYWSICDTTPPDPASNGAFNQFCLYRKDDGSSDYFFVEKEDYTTWSGSAWALDSTLYAALISDVKDVNALDYERAAPSVYNIAPAGFTCAGWANGRLFTGTTAKYNFSEYKFPMRFALTVDVNAFERSSGGFRFANESPKAFFALVGDANLDRLAIATDKGCYAISGLDTYSIMRPGRISQFGTNSPQSFSVRRNTTFFLDDNRRIHTFPEQMGFDALSNNVKDILDGIPSGYISKACSGVFDDFYYLFYTPTGQTVNNRAMVIDLMSGTLTRFSFSFGVTSVVVNGSRLLAFMSDGTILNITSGTGNVSGVSVVSREYMADERGGKYWAAKRQRIYVDDDPNVITATWTAYPSGDEVTDTSLSVDAEDTDVRTDRLTALNKGIRGKTVKFGLSGTLEAQTKLYEWQVEVEGRASGGDVSG